MESLRRQLLLELAVQLADDAHSAPTKARLRVAPRADRLAPHSAPWHVRSMSEWEQHAYARAGNAAGAQAALLVGGVQHLKRKGETAGRPVAG